MFVVGKKVFGIDGAGQSAREGLCGREGKIVGMESNRWGEFVLVLWDGAEEPEPYTKHTVLPAPQQKGIGVYYAE